MQYSFTSQTPFANFGVRVSDDKIVAIESVAKNLSIKPGTKLDQSIDKQIQRYCKQTPVKFDLPLKLQGTEFQLKVWRALQQIPAGKVLTYGALAAKLSTSARAVGNACRRNPVLLVVPCHRVVAANGIGGFAGKTHGKWMQIKRRLLAHEGVVFD
jgi:methylated-DNA-[protein]-cysteine S-methyltransferase